LVLLDSRPNATTPELTLSGLEKAAYEFCDELQSATSIVRHLRSVFPEVEFAQTSVVEFLDSLVAHGLMITDGSNYLSMALRTPALQAVTEPAKPFWVADFPVRPASSYLRAELKVLQA
jgi:hypothetical protein